MSTTLSFETVVIGGGREAIGEALALARTGRRVAILEPIRCNDQTPSTAELHRAAMKLGGSARLTPWLVRQEALLSSEVQRDEGLYELDLCGVERIHGEIRFRNQSTVAVSGLSELAPDGVPETCDVVAQQFVLALGTHPLRPNHISFDDQFILDSETFWQRAMMPRSLIIIGAGDVGLDHALLLGSMGVDVTVIDEKAQVRDVYQGLMGDSRISEAQSFDVAFRLGDEVISVERLANNQVTTRLASGKVFSAEAALVCVGRVGNTEGLNLDKAGVGLDERGRVWCNSQGQTWAVPIKAIGDVIGFRGTHVLAG